MPLFAIAALLLLPLVLVALVPVSLVHRYRMGTARRLARGWLATLNAVLVGVSAVLYLASAAIASFWLKDALLMAAGGLLAGSLLGSIGVLLSRFEPGPGSLHYTPNRWLVLLVTSVVTLRVLYGFWRAWETWQTRTGHVPWLVASGASGTFAAGAVVLGYYLAFWIGVRRRLAKHRRRQST